MFYEADYTPIRVLSVIRLSWQGGFFTVAPRNHCALIYRVRGSGVFTVNGKKIVSNSGDIFFMPQGQEYTADYTDGEIIAFHFITDANIGGAENYTTKNSEELYRLFMSAKIAYNSNSVGFKNRTVSIFYEILATLCEAQSDGALPPTLLDALSFIRANFKNSALCIPNICRECGVGETALRKNFRQYLSKSPLEYITELRLENAKTLILSGASVERAANESGFCDPKYFSRLVKKHFGCTPRGLNEYGR